MAPLPLLNRPPPGRSPSLFASNKSLCLIIQPAGVVVSRASVKLRVPAPVHANRWAGTSQLGARASCPLRHEGAARAVCARALRPGNRSLWSVAVRPLAGRVRYTARSGCVTGRGTSTPACALRPTRTRGNRTVESGTLHVQQARHGTVSASYLPQYPWLPSFMRLTRARPPGQLALGGVFRPRQRLFRPGVSGFSRQTPPSRLPTPNSAPRKPSL